MRQELEKALNTLVWHSFALEQGMHVTKVMMNAEKAIMLLDRVCCASPLPDSVSGERAATQASRTFKEPPSATPFGGKVTYGLSLLQQMRRSTGASRPPQGVLG